MRRMWVWVGCLLVTSTVAGAQEVDTTTPRRAMQVFLDAARAEDWQTAASVLQLDTLPPAVRQTRGLSLARQLSAVLDQMLWVDVAALSDETEGEPADGADVDRVGQVPLGHHNVPILLSRRPEGWRVSASTLNAVPALAKSLGGMWLLDVLPRPFFTLRFMEIRAWQWLGLLALLLAALVVSLVARAILLPFFRRLAKGTSIQWDDALVDHLEGPARWFVTLATFHILLPLLHLAVPARQGLQPVLRTAFVLVTTWAALRMVAFVADTLERRMAAQVHEEALLRGVKTQVRVLRRVAAVVITILGGALVLMQFEVVKNVGASMLASAGVAGIVVGLAAQRSISTLLAGIQLSLTQPIRIGDTVIVEKEWGWIEEITLTYVVVKVWDLRRLVVPITKFLETPFENWSKVGTDIMGTVNIWADYTVPVEAVRAELKRVVTGNPLWDGKVANIQITDANDRVMLLRALVSSADSGKNWDLRCLVREKLTAFMTQLEGGRYLPVTRVGVRNAAHPADGDAVARAGAPAVPPV